MCVLWTSCIMKYPSPCHHTVWHHPCLMGTSWCLQNVHWIVVCQSLKIKPENPWVAFPTANIQMRCDVDSVGFLSRLSLVSSDFAYGDSLILHRYLQIPGCLLRKYIPQSLPLKNASSLAPVLLPVLNKSHCPFRAVAANCRHMGQFSSCPPSSVSALPPSSLMDYMYIPVTSESPSSHSPS